MKLKSIIAIALLAGCTALAAAENPPGSPATSYVRPDYRLGVDDVIDVSIYGEKDLSIDHVVVRPDGFISTPRAKEVMAIGKTIKEVETEIAAKLSETLAQRPEVTVIVKETNSAKVSVLGEVKNPSSYKIGDRATVLDAIAAAGGFTEYANKKKVTVIRILPDGKPQNVTVDVNKMISGKKTDLFYVQPYDKIIVQ